MPYIQDSLEFLIETLLGLYLVAVILRFLFQLFRIDFHNPISQVIVKVTNPPLRILRRFIPGFYGVDFASIALILIVSCAKIALTTLVKGYSIAPLAALVLGLAEAISIVCWTLLIAIFIRAIMSWIAPRSHHPALRILDGLSEPVLAPFRRLLPNMGGLDLSPILAILALQLAQKLLVRPLLDLGVQLL